MYVQGSSRLAGPPNRNRDRAASRSELASAANARQTVGGKPHTRASTPGAHDLGLPAGTERGARSAEHGTRRTGHGVGSTRCCPTATNQYCLKHLQPLTPLASLGFLARGSSTEVPALPQLRTYYTHTYMPTANQLQTHLQPASQLPSGNLATTHLDIHLRHLRHCYDNHRLVFFSLLVFHWI